MRVLSVSTLISPEGEYGGPVRVATNQARALAQQGHEVLLAGAARGFDGPLPRQVEGVPAALFAARQLVPGTGFAGVAAPGLLRALPALAGAADVLHVHAARDLVTLPVAAWALRHRIPYVLQTHGMIDASTRRLARPLDALLTRRVLRGARAVLHLTDLERESLIEVAGPDLPLQHLPNGVPEAEQAEPATPPEVLYLARLAPRKRPAAFVEMAARLAGSHPGTRFRLVGPDEGEGPGVQRRCSELAGRVDVAWEGPLAPELTRARMAAAAVYVLPSVDEPYPMSVLEAMSIGLPVVVTESCGLAPAVREWGAGRVAEDSLDSLVAAVDSLLFAPEEAARMGRAGRRRVREQLGMPAIAHRLIEVYS